MVGMKVIFKAIAIIGIYIIFYIYGAKTVENGEEYAVENKPQITVPDLGTEGKKSINKAKKYDIKQVKGFGDKRAKQVIECREELGGFKGMEDLVNVSGIGVKRYEKLREKFSL